jgi:hypothetical protein
LILRFSPVNVVLAVTTAIFSTCGMTVIVFSVACILSMPKQLITVYIGVILKESGSGRFSSIWRCCTGLSKVYISQGTESTRDKIISDAVLGVTIAVTAGAMWYILRKMRQVKPDIIYAKRKARQVKLARANFTPYHASNNSSNSVVFNASETNIPLNPTGDLPYGAMPPHQQWDKEGRAIGYAGDPRLYAPAPRPPQNLSPADNEVSDVGTIYPQSKERGGGRTPLRQESGDSVEWNGRRDTFDIPRIVSPVHEPIHNPFESNASQSAPSQTPTQAQFSQFGQQPTLTTDIASPPPPNPFTGVTPTQFNHPQVPIQGHAVEATDASFYTADVHSRAATEQT